MRIEDIFNNGKFIGSLAGTETFGIRLSIVLPGFVKSTELFINQIPSQNLNTKIYLRLESLVNTLINISTELQNQIWKELWDKYIFTCEETEPFERFDSEDIKSMNIKYYGIEDIKKLKEVTKILSIDTALQINDDTYNDEFANNELSWNINFGANWIGDGFIRISINSNKILNCELHN